ncbi:MAG: hypothetical protein J6V06_06960 [Clostridia bacterium]|nr:hypothetical protein [Clostridia bacterium]MBO7319739.1 hypothetical protein [Clostridia bacterium]
MITDKQFDDAFTAAGGWFILSQYETLHNWKGTNVELAEILFKEGFDSSIKGTKTRVACALRIINEGRGEEALLKIRNSDRINHQHPEAKKLAQYLLDKYY